MTTTRIMLYNICVFLFMVQIAFAQQGDATKTKILPDTLVDFSVRPAPEWTNLFYRSEGWFGADGIFSMNLNGLEKNASQKDSIFMYFSDTMTGITHENSVENFKMINNSIAQISGTIPSHETVQINMNTNSDGQPINYFDPNTPNTKKGEYYWFGDGFVNQKDENSINIFGYRVIDHSEKSWDFEVTGVTLLTIPRGSKPPFKEHNQIDAPLLMNIEGIGKGTFGSAIFVNTKKAGAPNPDGYLYIYGLLDPNKQLVVARVKPKLLKEFNAWRFWDGTGWNTNINNVKPITNRASNEVSLTPPQGWPIFVGFSRRWYWPAYGHSNRQKSYRPFRPNSKDMESP